MILNNLWMMINEFAPFLILGFFISGILSVFLTVEIVQKYLGSDSVFSVFLASLLGVPLPLCSCGVIPVSAYLSKHGASKGSVTSFLISTPQTGVDSIFITYAMLGPLFAIYRPIIAFISGILGGSLVYFSDNNKNENVDIECEDDCCNDDTKSKIYNILNYGFVKLPMDIAGPLIFGLVLSSLIMVFIPSNYFNIVGSGILGMLIMLIVGLPTYVCATASVPIAFALNSAGFSMGAVLVFLMTGPATNITTMSVIYKILGRKNLLIYLFSIIICSIGFGVLFDLIFPGLSVEDNSYTVSHILSSKLQLILSFSLVAILFNSLRIKYFSNKKVSISLDNNLLYIEGMTCNHCVDSVRKSLAKINGIEDININLSDGKLTYNSSINIEKDVIEVILSLGYKIKN
jgi:hypothetical protein